MAQPRRQRICDRLLTVPRNGLNTLLTLVNSKRELLKERVYIFTIGARPFTNVFFNFPSRKTASMSDPLTPVTYPTPKLLCSMKSSTSRARYLGAKSFFRAGSMMASVCASVFEFSWYRLSFRRLAAASSHFSRREFISFLTV